MADAALPPHFIGSYKVINSCKVILMKQQKLLL
jgi:hypothetical protein